MSDKKYLGKPVYLPPRLVGIIILLILALLILMANQLVGVSWARPDDPGTSPPPHPLPAILSDGQFVYGPNVGSFETRQFLEAQTGMLRDYGELVECQAQYYSINPKVLLTIIEMQSGLVTEPRSSPEAIRFAVQYRDAEGLQSQIAWLAEELYRQFYWHLYVYEPGQKQIGSDLEFVFQDGITVKTSGSLNAATYALQATLAQVSTYERWQRLASYDAPQGFYATYLRLFPGDNPLDTSNVIQPNATPPADLLKLPLPSGETWKFSGGPHAWDGVATNPWSSVDFAPPTGSCESPPTDRWVVAAASGTVSSTCGTCLIEINHGTGGWSTRYYHLTNPQVSVGRQLPRGRP